MHELELNIVAYSDLNVRKNGLYQMILHKSYTPLAICYSFDQGEIRVLDMTQNRQLPKELVMAVLDLNTIKYAYYAEWVWLQLCKIMQIPLPYRNWRSISQALVSVAVHSAIRQKKFICEKELEYKNDEYERFFCYPPKGVGAWTRATPEMFPEKWKVYKEKMKDDIYLLRVIREKFLKYVQQKEWDKQQYMVEIHTKRLNVQMERLVKESREESADYMRALQTVSHAIGLCNRRYYEEFKALISHGLDKEGEERVLRKIGNALEGDLGLIRYYRKIIAASQKEFNLLLRQCQYTGYLQGCCVSEKIIGYVLEEIILPETGKEHYLFFYQNLEIMVAAWLSGEDWILKDGNNPANLFADAAERMWGDREKADISEEAYQACLFGGGKNELEYIRKQKRPDTEMGMNRIVMDWRSANRNIVRFWGVLYRACCYTMTFKTTIETGKIKFDYDGENLEIYLPSGRRMVFMECGLKKNTQGCNQIFYLGTNEKEWFGKKALNGGKLFRIIIHAICQDIMSFFLENLMREKKSVILATDKYFVIDEKDEETAVERLQGCFREMPDWCADLAVRGSLQCLKVRTHE